MPTGGREATREENVMESIATAALLKIFDAIQGSLKVVADELREHGKQAEQQTKILDEIKEALAYDVANRISRRH